MKGLKVAVDDVIVRELDKLGKVLGQLIKRFFH